MLCGVEGGGEFGLERGGNNSFERRGRRGAQRLLARPAAGRVNDGAGCGAMGCSLQTEVLKNSCKEDPIMKK